MVFRCIPSSSTTPLSTGYAAATGGRWNPQETYSALYTFLSQDTARNWVTTTYADRGLSLNEMQSDRLPDLMVLNGTYHDIADLTLDEGLEEVGLPATYPIGYLTADSYSVTQPIGTTIYGAGHSSILTRSASASSWDGPIQNWAELVIFTDNAPSPEIVERVSSKDWLKR